MLFLVGFDFLNLSAQDERSCFYNIQYLHARMCNISYNQEVLDKWGS
jgi:arginyl-tRNA synthetase